MMDIYSSFSGKKKKEEKVGSWNIFISNLDCVEHHSDQLHAKGHQIL